ncbi:Hypothetical predicted protein [Pelobates cultripes]|uniref:Uncharacterized protein n=1 Tax=Pelobates cultripes TaxID=61616 RepID=A0AAD1STS2_PELCU|nr:Hypothetical predicted protein [Pelobates cultripes]
MAEAFLLHMAPLNLPKHSRKLIFLIVIAAQTLIARHWRSDSTPKEEELIDLIITNVAYKRFATLHMSTGNSNTHMYEMWQRYRLQPPPGRGQPPPTHPTHSTVNRNTLAHRNNAPSGKPPNQQVYTTATIIAIAIRCK